MAQHIKKTLDQNQTGAWHIVVGKFTIFVIV